MTDSHHPAAAATRLYRWKQQWWQGEDAALWCLLGHVAQLVRPSTDSERAVRSAAVAARHVRMEVEARQRQAARRTALARMGGQIVRQPPVLFPLSIDPYPY